MAVVGWILLGILGLLLLLLLFVLFFPFSYRLEGKKNSSGMTARVRVSWLFGAVRLLFDYPKPARPLLKIFFLTFNREKTQKERKRGTKQPKSKQTKPEQTDLEQSAQAEQGQTESEQTGSGQTEREEAKPAQAVPEQTDPDQTEQAEAKPEQAASQSAYTTTIESEQPKDQPSVAQESAKAKGEQPSPSGKKKKKERKKDPNSKISLADTYQKIRSEADFYLGLWRQEETKSLVSEVFLRVFGILKNIFPRKIKGRVVFGADSPDITGYAYAGYSILKLKFPKRLALELSPDFEHNVLEGEVFIAGHFQIATLLWNGIRILLDKRLKKIWKQLKRHKK